MIESHAVLVEDVKVLDRCGIAAADDEETFVVQLKLNLPLALVTSEDRA